MATHCTAILVTPRLVSLLKGRAVSEPGVWLAAAAYIAAVPGTIGHIHAFQLNE